METKLKVFPWVDLRPIIEGWFDDTTGMLQDQDSKCSSQEELLAIATAMYCVNIGREYTQAAFDLACSNKTWPAMAAIRPVMEYAIRLHWCFKEKSLFEARHARWEKDTASWRLKLARDWRDIAKKSSARWQKRDKKVEHWTAEKNRRSSVKDLPDLKTMADEVAKTQLGAKGFYPSYRILCEGSHAIMDLDQNFTSRGEDGILAFNEKREMHWMCPSTICYACISLVSAVWLFWPSWPQQTLDDMFAPAKAVFNKWVADNAIRRT